MALRPELTEQVYEPDVPLTQGRISLSGERAAHATGHGQAGDGEPLGRPSHDLRAMGPGDSDLIRGRRDITGSGARLSGPGSRAAPAPRAGGDNAVQAARLADD